MIFIYDGPGLRLAWRHASAPRRKRQIARFAAAAQRTSYLLIKLGEVALELAEPTLEPLGLRARHFNVMAMVAADPTLPQLTRPQRRQQTNRRR